uniref:NADH-ubiquinone oxidoreductase chain 5 n=2 Tax=Varanus salvator TaxID=62051 RepID=A0A0U5BCQ3_VARSL|nr:NADH dehydrogenase subunit 5 [Varanus salvator]BAU25947.1 NADH dehydrogenase subunit 5 [Varanus salvator komaini]
MHHPLTLTSMILSMTLLILPLTKLPKTKWYLNTTTAIQLAWLTSLIPLLFFINNGAETTITNIQWMLTSNLNINISFIFDIYSITFLPIALFVTWSILEFASWYMASDPHINKFFKLLLIFLITMMILVTANNMFQLFIGWEGVGAMSFLLINWWSARANANSAAIQAIIYNRIGDIGLILAMAWLINNSSTWDIQQIIHHTNNPNILPLLGLILAATGKSAQFGLHPWLPAAMEGPTPVSALLHSSTMVVAGIFLLIRLHPIIEKNMTALTTCLCLGAMTTVSAAMSAISQNDIKKVIAFSTSSQLGLMMVSIGLNQPQLAFFHISTHAFFKAMLFMCSGSIIHNLTDEQDLRKMGGMKTTLPITSTCFTIGTLALMGTPFLAGFYSKDAIIEAANLSTINTWALTSTMAATTMTSIYSLRTMFYVQTKYPRLLPNQPINESTKTMTNPIIRLALGSILTGAIMLHSITPLSPPTLTMPTEIKLSAITATILGFLTALELMALSTNMTQQKPVLQHHSNHLTFFNTLHRSIPLQMLSKGNTSMILDLSWMEKIGPLGLTSLSLTAIKKTTQKGLIKAYLSSLIIFIILTTTILTPP